MMETYQCNKKDCKIYGSHSWKNNFLRRIYFLAIFVFCFFSLLVVPGARDVQVIWERSVDAVFLHNREPEFADVRL
jgi:hypothetical protein